MESLKSFTNTPELFPAVSINPKEIFPSKISPILESDVIDSATNQKIGRIEFQLNERSKTMLVQHVSIDMPKQGYGVALYKFLQGLYPEYQLESSDSMNAKSDPSQEKANAVFLWEKLVSLGFAEPIGENKFRMKKE